MTHVLIVEDDGDIRAMLARGLSAEGFGVDLAGGVDEALSAARERVPEAVLLDNMLPDGSGHDVRHPELALVFPRHVVVAVPHADRAGLMQDLHYCSILHIARLEVFAGAG